MSLATVLFLLAMLPAGWLMSGGLLARVARGEHGAFKECLDRYGGLIWGLARKFSPTPADAEDATQDVFLHLWKNAARFDPARGSEAVFIVTLARRTLIDRFRNKQRRLQEVSLETLTEFEATPSAMPQGEDHVEAQLAAQALATLTAEQRRVIGLSVVQGLSQSEIATQTGMPLGTVKTAMRRGLLLVREKLGLTSSSSGMGGRS